MGTRLLFPPFSFDRDERTLRRHGATVPLAPKAAEALGLLLAVPGALVEKSALRDALWPDGFVEDGNLTQTIYLIRRALDPDGDGRAFVETVPRRGYRFVPPVRVAQEQPRVRGALLRAATAACALVALLAGVGYTRSAQPRTEPAGEAGRMYALGRYEWNRRTEPSLRLAIADFERVVALAPRDAHGYAGLAASYVTVADWSFTRIASPREAYRRAEREAREALARDHSSGEALAALGFIRLQRDRDLEEAERLLRRAIAFRPQYGPAYQTLGIVRLYRGDAESARAYLLRATQLDPLSVMDVVWYGKALYYLHRYDEARAAYRQALDLAANEKVVRGELALVDLELGRIDEARTQFARLPFPREKATQREIMAALVEVRGGHRPTRLPDLRPRATEHVDAADAAALCLALGRRDDALAWLAVGMRDPDAKLTKALLALDPRLAPLRDDPRFRALVTG